MESAQKLKLIDLSKPEAEIIQNLSEACFNHGFFHLVNHPIDPKLIASLF